MSTINNANRRSGTSAMKVRKDKNFKNDEVIELSTDKNIMKGEMKEIEAKRVIELRK